MKPTVLLYFLVASVALAFTRDDIIPTLTLKDGRAFTEVQLKTFSEGTVTARHSKGLVSISYSSLPDELNIAIQKYRPKPSSPEQKQKADAEAKARQEALKASREMEELIRKHEIVIGMTETQLSRSWGEPVRKNSSASSTGRREQWVYPQSQYVYLSDGIVTSWQQKK